MRDTDDSDDIEINSVEFGISRTPADATFGPGNPTASITTSSMPSPTASTDETSTTAASDSSETTTADPSPDNGGELSTGAKAGIGVGVALGVIGVAALAGAFWIVRKRKGGEGQGPSVDATELYVEPAGPKQPGVQVHEHYGAQGPKSVNDGPPSELADTRRERYELQ